MIDLSKANGQQGLGEVEFILPRGVFIDKEFGQVLLLMKSIVNIIGLALMVLLFSIQHILGQEDKRRKMEIGKL